jgi:hypothetical protein
LFDRLDCQDFLPGLKRVEIHHTQKPTPMAALYLRAWFQSILGEGFAVDLVHSPADVSWQIREVRLETAGSTIAVTRSEKGIVESHVRDFTSRSVFEVLDEARLVREEITILGKDKIFARVLELAAKA